MKRAARLAVSMVYVALSAASAIAEPAARVDAADPKDYAVIQTADHILAGASTCGFEASTISRLKQMAAAAAQRAGATAAESREIEIAAKHDIAVAHISHPNASPGPGCAASLSIFHGLAAHY